MTFAHRSLLHASPLSACDVKGSPHALQFLIHRIFVIACFCGVMLNVTNCHTGLYCIISAAILSSPYHT